MSQTPIAALHTEGRIYGTDWSIANVATLLRSNAARGEWRSAGASSGFMAKVNQNYLRTVSGRVLPTRVSVIFLQLKDENCWYASLCFIDEAGRLPWNADVAEQWLCALFGEDRPRLQEDVDDGGAHHFRLPKGFTGGPGGGSS